MRACVFFLELCKRLVCTACILGCQRIIDGELQCRSLNGLTFLPVLPAIPASQSQKDDQQDTGDQRTPRIPEMLELLDLLLFFKIEMVCHGYLD